MEELSPMLSACRAFAIAHSEAQNRSLLHLARSAGFGAVGSVFGPDASPLESNGSGVTFFLVHHRLSDPTMSAVIHQLRASDNDDLRYAPIFLIIDDCPYETILKYVRFGFDDILTLPEKREFIVDRMIAQLNSEHLYIQTDDYLGPDRRRMEFAQMSTDSRRRPDSPHARLHISRSVERGARVVKREFVGRRPQPGHAPSRPVVVADGRT